jgi:hypothetical protein
MTKAFWRSVALPVVATALAAPFMVHCGKVPSVPGGVPGVPAGVGGGCPDTTSVEAFDKFDLVKEWGLSADVATKLKNGVIASMELKQFGDTVEADLKNACTTLATDLGAPGTFANADAACKAAAGAMTAAKAKLGAGVTVSLDVVPPKCGASMDVMASCSGHCDASASGGSAKVECEAGKLQGTCDAQCTGSCDLTAAAACSGTCAGTCDANVKGKCGGNCNGKCDGKKSTGACTGTCEGKCDAHVEGTCSGNCGGSCKLQGAGSCKGTCSGGCSAEMKAPKCTGEITPPKVSAECKARCDGEVSAKLECTPAMITVNATGKADAKAFAGYKTVIEKDLPAILKTAIGLGQRATKMAGSVKDVVAGVQTAVTVSVKAGGANGAIMAGKIGTCFGGNFTGAADAAGSVTANVSLSASVQVGAGGASASGSASASASGKAGG